MNSIEEPRKITPDELRRFEGCQNLTDKEAEEIIDALYEFSFIAYSAVSKQIS